MHHKKPCSLASIIIFLRIVRTFPLQKERKSKSFFTRSKRRRDTADLIREDKMLLETGVGIFFSSSSLSQLFFCPGANALARFSTKEGQKERMEKAKVSQFTRAEDCLLSYPSRRSSSPSTFLGVQT